MALYNIAAIARNKEYSPNHVGLDSAILNEVADQLQKRGCRVDFFTEEKFTELTRADYSQYNACLTMSRSPRCVASLQALEDDGILVINSPTGIENCRRGRMYRILFGHHLPVVDSIEVDTDEMVKDRLLAAGFGKCWVKQSDLHSQHKEDVTSVRHVEEAQDILSEFFMRGITKALVSKHVEGRFIRFYGVAGSGFFKWYFSHDNISASDGSENLRCIGNIDINAGELQHLCEEAARILDVRIFGGDCVLLPDGELRIISVNDWPSFAPCRKNAASAIARATIKLLR